MAMYALQEQDNRFGFVKLQTASRLYYIQKNWVVLGRSPNASASFTPSELLDFFPISEHKTVSRQHALIKFNEDTACWELFCLSTKKNVIVNNDIVRFKDPPIVLHNYSTILLGNCLISFVLPKLYEQQRAIALSCHKKIRLNSFSVPTIPTIQITTPGRIEMINFLKHVLQGSPRTFAFLSVQVRVCFRRYHAAWFSTDWETDLVNLLRNCPNDFIPLNYSPHLPRNEVFWSLPASSTYQDPIIPRASSPG